MLKCFLFNDTQWLFGIHSTTGKQNRDLYNLVLLRPELSSFIEMLKHLPWHLLAFWILPNEWNSIRDCHSLLLFRPAYSYLKNIRRRRKNKIRKQAKKFQTHCWRKTLEVLLPTDFIKIFKSCDGSNFANSAIFLFLC